MRTELLIQALDSSFTTTFKHTSEVKWNVNFDNSDVTTITSNLIQLKHNIEHTQPNNTKVGYEITLTDVEHVQAILTELLKRWNLATNFPPPKKLYHFLDQLRANEAQSPGDIAKDIVKDILTPKPSAHISKKQQKEADLQAFKQERMLKMLNKRKR